jgi:hypothetical protein
MRRRSSAGMASSAACWLANSVSPPLGGITRPSRQVPIGGRCLKAPVRVPGLGKDRGRLVGAALHGDHVPASRDRVDEGVVAEGTEIRAEALEAVVVQRLIGKGQHVVLEPGVSEADSRFPEPAVSPGRHPRRGRRRDLPMLGLARLMLLPLKGAVIRCWSRLRCAWHVRFSPHHFGRLGCGGRDRCVHRKCSSAAGDRSEAALETEQEGNVGRRHPRPGLR